jgi:choline dehydrogenase
MRRRWDYIVIGAGSAGATVAARLSQNADSQVLLLESGGRAWSPRIRIPGLVEAAITDPVLNWNYQGDPDHSLAGRKLTWAAGRVLGGSSSINGMVYGRGLPADYARWVAAGNEGWGWDDMLPYFRRSEHWSGAPHLARGSGGPLAVRPFEETDAACRSTMDALVSLGVPFVADYNIGIAEGVGLTQATQKNGLRASVADAYLRPARQRQNLTILTHTTAMALLFDGKRCVGLRAHRRGKILELLAERETIVSAGAIGSPKLLLLSGIGAADALAPVGIKVVHERAGVGRNLNDHVNVKLSAFVDRPTYNTQRRGLNALRHGLRLLASGSGPASSPANHCQAFVRTDRSLPSADVQIQLMPFGFGSADDMRKNGLTAVVSPCQPRVRGCVSLRSADPAVPPRITMTMLEDPHDRDVLIRGCRLAYAALEDGPRRTMGGRIYAPQPGKLSNDDWLAFCRDTAALNWHPTSTCRMGPGPEDVVDARFQVHGLVALSVVDASAMPSVTSGNTNAPVIALAERAADMIQQRNR